MSDLYGVQLYKIFKSRIKNRITFNYQQKKIIVIPHKAETE